MKRLLLLTLLAALFCMESTAQSGEKQLNYIFKSGENGYATYRIPALVVTKNGTILAFAEGRVGGDSDTGDIDLLVKRSTDNGKSWSEANVVWDDARNTCGNPAPVIDSKTGKILLLSTWNLGEDHEWQIIQQKSKDTRRVYVQESSDDGVSWSQPRQITKDVKYDNWTWYATGPCHGIELTRGKNKGRLVVPCDHIESGTGKYYSHVIYSDDHGKSWQMGGRTPSDQVNECTVAETNDGLVLNMRSYDNTKRCRKVSTSRDAGLTWSEPELAAELPDPICQGSSYTYSLGSDGALLFLNAASEKTRTNMTLRLSKDGGKSWPVAHELYSGPSAYSDLARLKDGSIGCLYEAGKLNAYEGIVFDVVPFEELTPKN